MTSRPREIRNANSGRSPAGSPVRFSPTRDVSSARLASPVLSNSTPGTPSIQQVASPSCIAPDQQQDLPALTNTSPLPGPGPSALAAALARSNGRGDRGTNASRKGSASPLTPGNVNHERTVKSAYGSFDARDGLGSPRPNEDIEVVKRHLVQPEVAERRFGSPLRRAMNEVGHGILDGEFSSLKLQGGDVTRPIYRWTEENEGSIGGRSRRSYSFNLTRPEPESEVLDINTIKVPGGFRRNFLHRATDSSEPSSHTGIHGSDAAGPVNAHGQSFRRPLLTNNFLEFLTLYGHFAGEDLEEEDEEDLEPEAYFQSEDWSNYTVDADPGSDREPGEDSTLLIPKTPGGRKRKQRERGGTGSNSSLGAALLLLKSFVGTGVLFLPRAFLNGGMLFSVLVLLGVALLSYYCFILLVNTRLQIDGSFGDIGGVLYGKTMRVLILSSIVLSQIGFVSAYIVFTSENLQAFILAVSKCKTYIDIKFMVLMQLIIFLPLSLIRDISKLGFTALIADVFIMLGLIYLYYYDISTIVEQGGVSDITTFNPSTWTLFIGTAIFTFEGVGLIIPIQESMRTPHKFPRVLAVVMVIITALFLSIGALSYAAYGSSTKTVIILNLPQDDQLVNAVQFLYSLAILLSTPLQLFPAIRIMENEIFTRSGKHNPSIKWQKNVFRFCLVVICALIAWGGAGDLDKFVALVGSFACVPLVYVYPVSSGQPLASYSR